jgi:glycosyltransferase involved in cell wall biosynthesis
MSTEISAIPFLSILPVETSASPPSATLKNTRQPSKLFLPSRWHYHQIHELQQVESRMNATAAKPLRILLVGNYQPDQQQSMARYANWLKDTLVERGHMAAIFCPQAFFSKLAIGPFHRLSGLVKYLGYLDKYLLFPPRLRRAAREYDLVHICDHSNSMYLKPASAQPAVITCHDLLAVRSALGEFPSQHTGWPGRLLQAWILRGLQQAPTVVSVSEKTAADLARLTSPNPKRSQVILNPLNWHFQPARALPSTLPESIRQAVQQGTGYFFHIGGNQWYKNRAAVVQIFRELAKLPQYQSSLLVLAGKPPSTELQRELRREISQGGLSDRILVLVSVSNEDLEALYSNARALIFPSLQEGFGWPIAEAQACGCPVVTSNRAPMTEVAGEAAILIEPDKPQEAASTIASGLEARDALIQAGFENIRRFDPNKIADEYCSLYKSILSLN